MEADERGRDLAELRLEKRESFFTSLSDQEIERLESHWPLWARDEQMPPLGDWRVWVICAGRGFGKTRAGAEWVRFIAENEPNARIALVAQSLGEARSIMVEGESGILACDRGEDAPYYEPSLRRVSWPGGAQALLYSAAEPETLRGPQHSHAWCDEIAKWDNAGQRAMHAWDNLQLGLRLGEKPRVLATTTPRAVPLMQRLLGTGADHVADPDIAVTRGSTYDNAEHLPEDFLRSMRRQYHRTMLGRQELDGEMLEEIEGALWSRALLERCRDTPPPACGRGPGGGHKGGAFSPDSAHPLTPSRMREGEFRRVVVAVDPPASATGDACGIVVAGMLGDGTARVLADASVERASPERWARAVANAAQQWSADRVVAEANQGGAMVASVLRAADIALPLKLVHASRGKAARAEPVAALYEAGRVRHAGLFARLEDQMCGLMAGGTYEGPGRSPDRADALVWALTELMLKGRGRPRVRST